MDGRNTAVAVRRGLRGRRGGLRDMPNMPLDILVEIFSFLHPRDLLNLARTSPAFRAFLMSRSSAHFWKSARQTVEGLPDLPPYLSEPEYANLMFFPYCHSCLTTNIQNIIFEFSVRYCNQCKKCWLSKFNDEFDYLVEMVKQVTGIEKDVLNCFYIIGKDDIEDAYIHMPEYEVFRIAWETAIQNMKDVQRLVEEKTAAVELVQQSCISLYAWKDQQVQIRANELHGVRTERFNTLLDFLRQEGWGEELDMMHEDDYTELSQTPFARKAAKLTPRSWPKIREDAHAFMDDIRTIRLRVERQTVLQGRFAVLNNMINIFYGPFEVLRRAEWDADPLLIDLALTLGYRAIWDAPGNGPVELTATDPANISATIEFAMDDWKEALKMELIEKVHAAIPELAHVEDPLSLAIAGFSCRTCELYGLGRKRVPPLRFPEILAHPCLRSEPLTWSEDLYVATASTMCDDGPLSLENVIVDPTMVQNLRTIMEALGLDPFRITLEELNSTEARLWCTKCQHAPPRGQEGQILVKVQALDWMRALEHYNDPRHYRNSARPCRWSVLEASEAHSVRRQETRLRERPSALESEAARAVRRFGCHYCWHNCVGASSMVRHLQEHDKIVDVAGVGQYAYEHLDNKPFMLPIWVNYRTGGGYFTLVDEMS